MVIHPHPYSAVAAPVRYNSLRLIAESYIQKKTKAVSLLLQRARNCDNVMQTYEERTSQHNDKFNVRERSNLPFSWHSHLSMYYFDIL